VQFFFAGYRVGGAPGGYEHRDKKRKNHRLEIVGFFHDSVRGKCFDGVAANIAKIIFAFLLK
jgi:hypothetical protein